MDLIGCHRRTRRIRALFERAFKTKKRVDQLHVHAANVKSSEASKKRNQRIPLCKKKMTKPR